ncbi:uncharacterized protein ATC70_006207 [Mucor velutinosus]|uniref:Uncharacterized protein n=1 Tax=Mucor velutinosus TaxID=708070 RepID=A0AAN7HW39_9FUNG|nr:hypothetical protein ATC70_006207 [Mucor velutinosus]
MMSDASSYDKDTGYYRGTPPPDISAEMPASHQGAQQQPGLIHVPWDDDNFSLCLDTFPSSRLARTKYNQYPTTASPLRKQWGASSNCSSEHVCMDGDEDENAMRACLNDTPLPGLLDNVTPKKLSRATSNTTSTPTATLSRAASKRDMVAGGIFPYKNNGNFLTRIDSAKEPTKIVTQQYPLQRNSNRVEHISPLSNSSIILQNENDIFNQRAPSPKPSLSHRSSNSSVHSRFFSHSVLSHPIHRRHQEYFSSNNSQFSDNYSQYSDSGESWKLAQKQHGSPIIVMPSIPAQSYPIASQHQQYHHRLVHLTKSSSYSQYRERQQEDAASVGSASVRYVGASQRDSDINYTTPLQYGSGVGSSIGFYTPQASPAPSVISRGSAHESVSTYRSIAVPRNADALVLYTAYEDITQVKNRDSTYSQVFDPAYNGRRKKSTRKNMTSGIFAKLIKNLKQHFMKPTTKQ